MATGFAISVFSQLLHHSLLRLAHLLHASLSDGKVEGFACLGLERKGSQAGLCFHGADGLLEDGRNMVDIILGKERSKGEEVSGGADQRAGGSTAAASVQSAADVGGTDPKMAGKGMSGKARKSHRYLDRRRRLRLGKMAAYDEDEEESSDDEEEEQEDVGNLSLSSSEDNLSLLSDSVEADGLDLLESLSETSSSDDEEDKLAAAPVTTNASLGGSPRPGSLSPYHHHPPRCTLSPRSTPLADAPGSSPESSSAKPKPRRTVAIAANFSNPSPPTSQSSPAPPPLATTGAAKPSTKKSYAASRAEKRAQSTQVGSPPLQHGPPLSKGSATGPASLADSTATSAGDRTDGLLRAVMEETLFQSAVHAACCLAAGEDYLMVIKVFADWLLSYPVVIATSVHVSYIHASKQAHQLGYYAGSGF